MATRGRKLTRVLEIEDKTVGEVAEEFYTYNKVKDIAIATQKQYKQYVGNFVKWYGEENSMSDLTAATFDKYIEKKAKDGIKTVSIATNMKHLRAFVKFAIKRSYMLDIEVTIPKFDLEQKEPYTEEEMRLLLEKPRGNSWAEYRNWVMINYFFSTGQR